MLSELLKSPDRFLEKSETRIIKNDPTSTVGVVRVDEKKIVIKEHKMRSFLIGFKYLFFPSRASKCWRNSHLLSKLGIPTPKAVGYTVKRKGIFKIHSYYLYEFVEGVDGKVWLSEKGAIDSQLAHEIVQLIAQLKSNQITYDDFKIANLVISEGKPWLIDIHAIKKYRWWWLFSRKFRQNVKRFMRCWEKHPNEKKLFEDLLQKFEV